MKLIDVHCHLLPRIDDGARSVEESIRILKEARRQGVVHMIVTPHYRHEIFEPPMEKVLSVYREMREIAFDMGIRLSLGCEYFRSEDMISDFDKGKRPTMAGGRYVLVEFMPYDSFSVIRNAVYELTTHGYKPIIAHAERYLCCQELGKILELREMNAYIQLNAGSVIGNHGWRMKRFCLMLMKNGVVDFIASDTHNMSSRKMNMKECALYVSKKMGTKYANRIFIDNPLKILESRCKVEKG